MKIYSESRSIKSLLTGNYADHHVDFNSVKDDGSSKCRFSRCIYHLFLFALLILIVDFALLIIYDLILIDLITSSEVSEIPLIMQDGIVDLSKYDMTSTNWALADECAIVPNEDRFDCFPRGPSNESVCTQRGCCWKPTESRTEMDGFKKLDVPWCYYPVAFKSYEQVNKTVANHVTTVFLRNVIKSPYPDDVPLLRMVIKAESNFRVHVKIEDATGKSFETPYPDTPVMSESISETALNYKISIEDDGPGFTIQRKSNGQILFDTRSGGFIFSKQFIQISSKLLSNNIYGLGEHRNNFMLDTNWNRITLFAHDSPPLDGINGYGSHPFLLNVANGGQSHGVFLKNSHPMEIILQPAPAITYRVLGGVLDFYFFVGPSPADVTKQYFDLIGYPFMPPYWSLGFHMCKYGQSSLQVTMDTLNRTMAAGIPVDVQWNDLDYMDRNNDFTRNKKEFAKLPEFIENLHSMGMHYVPILDPGVSAAEPRGTYPPFDEGLADQVFIKNESGLPLVGRVWSQGATVWPDFTNQNTITYWLNQLKRLHEDIPFDGLWIDMNEPSNFVDGSLRGCENNPWDNPPYTPIVEGGHLNFKTICMNAEQYLGKHYQLHNVHGFSEAIASNFALTEIRNKRPFIISRSTFAGQGKFSGHWTGDVFSTWNDMKHSVADIMSFNLFGIPMVGADICGFNGNTTADLCQRWLQLGAFYPFSRTHNSDDCIDQDPVSMGPEVVASTKKALEVRYMLLPYLYSLFWRAHAYGETVARSLFFEYPEDTRTYNISTQFMWGSALLIVPVLKEGDTFVQAYLPGEFWYDLKTFKRVVGGDVALSAPMDIIPVLVKPKSIIPFQYPGNTTTERLYLLPYKLSLSSRLSPFGLLVALDSNSTAEGFLYWDDGDSLMGQKLCNPGSAATDQGPGTSSRMPYHFLRIVLNFDFMPLSFHGMKARSKPRSRKSYEPYRFHASNEAWGP
ncbi:lysosomal alpha-glucosidase isoform X3 [Bemisia tabaci]|uniref:lysosomal alpha-glucosidase isoform X3 n=1 Tax=Bemisia tabaci TaxID=7038 RepID=UPI003B2805A4